MRGTRRQVLAGAAAAGALGGASGAWAGAGGAPFVVVDEAAGPDWREALKPWISGSPQVRRVADGVLIDPMALARDAGARGGRLVALLGSANHLLLIEAVRQSEGRVLLEQRLDAGRPTHMTLAMLPAQGRRA